MEYGTIRKKQYEKQTAEQGEREKEKELAWLARAMPLKAAASRLEPNSQSPHMPALP